MPEAVSVERPDDNTVSVIITDANYGHFLPACLDSLRRQTCPPDEIIVVNDGSSDSSAAFLAGENGLTVIDTDSLGQAAAFNAGFRASSGDIVIFLDADDRLKPDAIDVVRRLWSDDVSCLCYDLELIDRDGNPTGHYEMRVPEQDLRWRLLRDLGIHFMPTSGNAFARSAISWAFPLPEPEWKLSADAILIRAAIFAAPIRHLPHTLGEYRTHRHNNWFREVASDDWRLQRGRADIARTGLELVRMAEKAPGGLSPAERLMLLFASIRSQITTDALSGGNRRLSFVLREAARLWPTRQRPAVSFLLAVLRLVLPRSETVRTWALDRSCRPAILDRILNLVLGPRLRDGIARAVRVRPPFGRLRRGDALPRMPLDAHFEDTAWNRYHTGEHFDLCADAGEIRFARATSEPVEMVLDMEPLGGRPVEIDIVENAVSLARFRLMARGGIPLQLGATRSVAPPDTRIEIRIAGWPRQLAGAARVRIHGFSIFPSPGLPTGAVLPVSQHIPFRRIAGAARPETRRDGSTSIVLAPPPISPPYCLSLICDSRQSEGWLSLECNGSPVFHGTVGPNGHAIAEITEQHLRGDEPLRIGYSFRPKEFTDAADLRISTIGWRPDPGRGPNGFRLLPSGAWIGPDFSGPASAYLAGPWDTAMLGAPTFFSSSAALRFAMEPGDGSSDRELRLDIGPALPRSPEGAVVLAVSINGRQAAALRLAGRDIVKVPIDLRPQTEAAGIEVGLHAMDTDDQGAPRPHDGVTLHGFGLAQRHDAAPDILPRAPDAQPRLLLASLPERRLAVLSDDELATLRASLRGEIDGLSDRALEDFLTPAALSQIVRIGALLPDVDAGASPPPDWVRDGPDTWLRWLARTMLGGPGWMSAPDMSLAELPRLDVSLAPVIGRWSCLPATCELPARLAGLYGPNMARRLREARRILASHDIAGSGYRAALSAVRACDLDADHTGSGNAGLAQAFAAALEARLLREGRRLLPPPSELETDDPGLPRIGLIARRASDFAPGGAAAVLAAGLARLGHLTAFTAETAGSAQAEGIAPVVLDGQTTGAAVERIRRARADVVFVASPISRDDGLARIVAHRLAPRQYVVPPGRTTALASFDGSFSEDRCTAEEFLSGPALALFDRHPCRGPDRAAERQLQRARLGIDPDAKVAHILLAGHPAAPGTKDMLRRLATEVPGSVHLTVSLRDLDRSAEYDRLFRSLAADPRLRFIAPGDNAGLSRLACHADALVCAGASVADLLPPVFEADLPALILCTAADRMPGIERSCRALGLAGAAAAPDKAARRLATLLDEGSPPPDAPRARDVAKWLTGRVEGARGYPPAPRYLFHHMPKTAGTSFRFMLARWFDVTLDYKKWFAPEVPPPLDLSAVPPGGMLVGHFGSDQMPLGARYPETLDASRWRRITFVRDPLARALSWHAFETAIRPRHDPDFVPVSLSEFLRTAPSGYLEHFECDTGTWREALDGYWFIGTVERFDECIDYLAKELGKPRIPTLHFHRTAGKFDPDPQDVACFMERMKVEFDIYREISRRLSERLGGPAPETLHP